MDRNLLRVLFFVVSLYSRIEYIQCEESAGPNIVFMKDKPVIEFSNSSINASSGEVDLNAGTYGFERPSRHGDSLNITCYSNLPAHWVVVQGEETIGPNFEQSGYLKDIVITESTEGYRYASNLYIDNIKFDYTGLYVCRHEKNINVNSSIFIFAKDIERPFTDRHYIDIPNYPNHLTLYMDKSFRVPCQTSFPDIIVAFRCHCKNRTLFGPEQGVVFDPRKGVLIENVDDSFNGMFVCETKINNDTYSRTFTLVIHVSPDVLHMPSFLVPSEDIHKVIGESFKLACFVKVRIGIRPYMTWSYTISTKQDVELKHNNRVTTVKPYKTDVEATSLGLEEFRGELAVREVTTDDQGIYKCTVWISDKIKSTVETQVYVHDSTFVYLMAEEENITVRENEDKKADFFINVNAYPEPQFYWQKDGRNITKQDIKIESEIVDKDQIMLRVKHPKREDAGTYTVMVSVPEMNKSLDVDLIVEYVPEVKITSNNRGSEYYLTDIDHKINCSVKSVPFSTRIDWFEQTCESPIKCNIQNDEWKPVNVTDLTSTVYPKQVSFKLDDQQIYLSQLTLRDKCVGSLKYYKCVGRNKVGTNSASLRYVATDVQNGFDMWAEEKLPVVGDTVKMYFKASAWKYSNLTVMNRTHATQVEPGWAVNRTNITYIREKQSVMTVVTITPIIKYDRYDFASFAYDVHGRKIDRPIGELRLTVRDIELPIFTTEPSKKFYDDNSFAYECKVDGLPKPTISWFKDFKKFDPQNMAKGYVILDEGQRLRINATDSSFSGIYTCVAENKGGFAARNFTFRYAKLSVTVPASVSRGKTIIIVCFIVVAVHVAALVVLVCYNRRKSKFFSMFNNSAAASAICRFRPDDKCETNDYTVMKQ